VDGVDSITLLKRRDVRNFDRQYDLDDPYGRDLVEDGYIGSFLRGEFQATHANFHSALPPRRGYTTVYAPDARDGSMHSYTARFDNPGSRGPGHPGTFFLVKGPVAPSPARYGVTWDDISTKEDRDVWIAGSRLRVVDTQTGEVLGERVGYMIDRGQGAREGDRSPWLLAARDACPAFGRDYKVPVPPSAFYQLYQTLDFVEKVLRPN
jgi:hypothetical protein